MRNRLLALMHSYRFMIVYNYASPRTYLMARLLSASKLLLNKTPSKCMHVYSSSSSCLKQRSCYYELIRAPLYHTSRVSYLYINIILRTGCYIIYYEQCHQAIVRGIKLAYYTVHLNMNIKLKLYKKHRK